MAIVGTSSAAAHASQANRSKTNRGHTAGAAKAESFPSTCANSPRDSASGYSDSNTNLTVDRRNSSSTKTQATGGAPGRWSDDVCHGSAAPWYPMPEGHFMMPGMPYYDPACTASFDQASMMMMTMMPPSPPTPKVLPHTPVSQASTQAATPTTGATQYAFFQTSAQEAARTENSEELTHLMVGGESVSIEALKLFLYGASSPNAKLPSPEEMAIRLAASAPLRYED